MAESEPRERYDVVVIGGGPAGLSAALYTWREGLSTALIAGELGGQVRSATRIENYLGLDLVTGAELADRFTAHVRRFGIDVFEGRFADALVPVEDGFEIHMRDGLLLKGRAVIIACGRSPVRLAVPGEKELLGRGVSYCATCDAAFFRGRPVVVLGPGESAADAALQCATLDCRVVLVSEQPLVAPEGLVAKLAAEERVQLRTGLHVTRIDGDDRVTGVALADEAGVELVLPVDAVFIEAGSISVGEFTGGLVQVNEDGEVTVDNGLMTTCAGVFAAGDVTDALGRQIVIAAGEGARAAVAAARWLQRQ